MGIQKLSAGELYHACNPEYIPFDSTAEAENHLEILGQSRALEAIGFGVGTDVDFGFHVGPLYMR